MIHTVITYSLYYSFQQIRRIASQCVQKYKAGPNLVVCVIPDGAVDVYTAVKQ